MRSVRAALARALSTRVGFCIALAAGLVLCRLAIFDFPEYFALRFVPNHDMYQGAPFFAMSMHSMRLSGDIAWWDPASHNGYAVYYQHLLSPVAPTANSIVFIVWAQLIKFLAVLGIVIPEYYQYLFLTYVVYAFAATLSFAWFVSQIFRRRATVALATVVYTLSGIGIWNGAWMFFQEPAAVFFVLGSALNVVRRPALPNAFVFVLALLLQVTSVNYWTIYNSWFVILVLGTYAAVYATAVPRAMRLLGKRLRTADRQQLRWAALLCGLACVLWIGVVAAAYVEQSPHYARNLEGGRTQYTWVDAVQRIKELRKSTTELFNPSIDRAMAYYQGENGAHNARYVGVILIPFLVIAAMMRWGRRELWLLVLTASLGIIVLAPPFIVGLWGATPLITQVQHLFYFYSQYLQIAIVLFACCGLDRLLTGGLAFRQRFLWPLRIQVLWAVAVFAGASLFAGAFAYGDKNLQAVLYSAILVAAFAGLLLRWITARSAGERRVFAVIVAALALTDFTKYYWDASTVDHRFTATRPGWDDFRTPAATPTSTVADPLPEAVRQSLAQPWSALDVSKGFEGGIPENMPVANLFWPSNNYLIPAQLQALSSLPPAFWQHGLNGPALQLYPKAEGMQRRAEILADITAHPDAAARTLLLSADDASIPPAVHGSSAPAALATSWQRDGYNTFAWKVEAPVGGWLLVRQLFDPSWQIRVDGQRVRAQEANLGIDTAVAIAAGAHLVTMDYMPLSRRLYWPSVFVLEAALIYLIVLTGRSRKEHR